MISIVTGTLNRKSFLNGLITNTVEKSPDLELVLVDGGSNDGTIEYLKNRNHPQIKLVQVGKRSSYPHFMNLGIKAATHEYICQWNDDVLLVNPWEEVFNEIDNETDFYLFNWKYGRAGDVNNNKWIQGKDQKTGWCMVDDPNVIVMNYGIYHKKIFRKIGMYNPTYQYYYADGDMAMRAKLFGYKHKGLRHIRVCSLITKKVATHHPNDRNIYDRNIKLYREKTIPNQIEKLI